MFDKITEYIKGIAVIVGSILTAVAAVLPDVPLWLKITIAAVTAASVIILPNRVSDAQVRASAKHLEEPGAVASSLLSEENRRIRDQ